MIRVGVIGYGYWGPNVVRNFRSLEGSRVEMISDKFPHALKRAQQASPGVAVTTEASEVIRATNIDAVAVVTPVWTHYELAKAALENGKHVFVEKPFTATAQQAEELIELAAKKNLTIMVDHTFLYTGAVRKIRELADNGTLGNLYYYDSTRVNLGLFQHDVNVIWDLAPHDLSIMDYVIQDKPQAVVATGQAHLNSHEDIAFITVYFQRNVIAHINVNWLSPVKVRTTLIGGEKKMLVWNDLEADEKIKVYDKGVDVSTQKNVYDLLASYPKTSGTMEEVISKTQKSVHELLVSYRSGDMWAPQVEQVEALHVELAHFVDCAEHGKTPISDGLAGLRVVRMLEAAEQSLRNRGRLVEVPDTPKATVAAASAP